MQPVIGILRVFFALRLVNSWVDGHHGFPGNLFCGSDAGEEGKVPRSGRRRTIDEGGWLISRTPCGVMTL
jgi:hypothetical protein